MGLYIERGYNLQTAKEAIEAEILAWYGGAALDTFDCSVLGAAHRYECNEAAQLRFINGKVSNSPIMLTCGDLTGVPSDEDPVWGLKQHTATECGKVHTAYTQFASSIDLQLATYRQQAAAATSVEQVELILADILS
jgi:hypothetical protein